MPKHLAFISIVAVVDVPLLSLQRGARFPPLSPPFANDLRARLRDVLIKNSATPKQSREALAKFADSPVISFLCQNSLDPKREGAMRWTRRTQSKQWKSISWLLLLLLMPGKRRSEKDLGTQRKGVWKWVERICYAN